jgi:hypothetical protein
MHITEREIAEPLEQSKQEETSCSAKNTNMINFWRKSIEAEFLDEIQTKVFRVFHLYRNQNRKRPAVQQKIRI